MKPAVKYSIVGVIVIGLVALIFWSSQPPSEAELAEIQRIEEERIEKEKEEAEKKKKAEVLELRRRPIPINPQGTYLIHQLFKNYARVKKMKPMQSPIADHLPLTSTNAFPNVYMILGDGGYLDYEDVEHVMDFLEEGNTVFLSVSELSYPMETELFYGTTYNSVYSECIDVNFAHDSVKMYQDHHLFYEHGAGEIYSDYWKFWNVSDLRFSDYAVISHGNSCDDFGITEYPLCVKVKVGEGTLILHAEPHIFSNKQLMEDEKGVQYAERIFSHLPRGNFYWHQLGGRYSNKYIAGQGSEEGPNFDGDGYGQRPTSPLQHILSVDAFKWALYILLGALFILIIFQAKRRRRIVPAAEKRTNSSVEFADTVSRLYFQEKRHDKLIRHIEMVFKDYVRNKYYLRAAKPDQAYITNLAKKSGIDQESVQRIFDQFEIAKKSSREGIVDDSFLIELNNNIDNFYKNCK